MLCKKKRVLALVEHAQSAMSLIAIMAMMGFTVACTPTFNWREVSLEQAGVMGLLPCKPDRGTRQVQLAGQTMPMTMAGCESGGALFTISFVPIMAGVSAQSIAQALQANNKATHSRQLQSTEFVAQAAIYGQPKEGRDGPSALSAQAVETFMSSFSMVGAK
jgi:hypothetical protein